MYQTLDPILESDVGATWLTVGDGRYGLDARYVLDHGSDAVASDISEILLEEGRRLGLVPTYRVENAEAMTAADDDFDYVLCKESYHHFPRPALALYEMLRIARKAVVLIEPADEFVYENAFCRLAHRIASWRLRLRGSAIERNSYEESGNYVYSISRREIEKVALGLNLPAVAFHGINDTYIAGVEHEALADNGPLQAAVKRQIRAADLRCRVGWRQYNLLCAVVFLEPPDSGLRANMSGAGFSVIDLPRNPYADG